MDPQLSIVHLALIRDSADPCTVVVSGEIDIYTVPDLRDSLQRAVDSVAANSAANHAACAPLRIDLSGVSFIDARGLSVLSAAGTYGDKRGVCLEFSGVSAAITRLLRITGISLRIAGASAVPETSRRT
jgi:anti-sigma B factor antagonist